jgi:hypothetical protein
VPVATEDPDQILLRTMSEPPPLEQARTSLEFWTRRRSALPVYRRAARREADEMIRRCRARVAAAERLRYGTGPIGFVRRVLARDGASWRGMRAGLLMFAWALVPRRFLLVVTAVALVWVLVGVLALVTIAQLFT